MISHIVIYEFFFYTIWRLCNVPTFFALVNLRQIENPWWYFTSYFMSKLTESVHLPIKLYQ